MTTLPGSPGCGQAGAETAPERPHLVKVLGVVTNLRVSGNRDAKISTIAEAQRGRVSRGQLHAAGISKDAITRLIRRHALHPLPGGVFAVGHRAPIELGDETAALLAAPEGTVLSHHTAGVLWDMRRRGDDAIHITVPGSSSLRLDGVRVHRSRMLLAQDIRIHRALRVTSPARTLLDLAEVLTGRQLELALDRALVARTMRLQDVAELLSRVQGRAGGPILRALLEHQGGPTLTRSEAEERFLGLIRSARLPEPRVNARIHGFEVDFLWPKHGLVVEIDGFRFHGTRRAFEHDHGKDAVLRAAALEVLRFTYLQLEREAYAVVAQVARGLS